MSEYTEMLTMIVNHLPAIVRRSPDHRSAVLVELQLGTEVEVVAIQDAWMRLRCGGWLDYAALARAIEEDNCFEVARY